MQTSFRLLNGYYFTELKDLSYLKNYLYKHCENLSLLGTILLSHEGINVALAGLNSNCELAKKIFSEYPDLKSFKLTEYPTSFIPFTRLKVRIRPEIITLGQTLKNSTHSKYLDPIEFERIQNSFSPMTILDTRNSYEIEFGSFKNSVHLNLSTFREFPTKALSLDPNLKNKPFITVCTGGIRCEKASFVLNQIGFNNVYQLKGGILNYFQQTRSRLYQGTCFVFDDRWSIDSTFQVKKSFQDIGHNSIP